MYAIFISIKKLKIILILVFCALIIFLVYRKITKPLGVQKVSFTYSKSETYSKGKMTFSIFKASGGVNQDIIYHFHGRNLDHTIWNDDTYFTALVQSHWQNANTKPPTVVLVRNNMLNQVHYWQ